MTEAIRKQLAAHGAKLPPKARSGTTTPRTAPRPHQEAPKPPASRRELVISFDCKVPGNNGRGGLLRMHYRTKQALLAAYGMRVLLQAPRLRFAGPVRMELTRYSTGRAMDYDNLVSTGKLLLDAIVRNGVLPDDSPDVIAERHYTQQRVTQASEQRTLIRLIPL